MARLNHPADPSRLTPVAEQALDATPSSEPAISSPTPTQASLQSHRNNDLPYPPARGGSERLSFSPADCRTLDKLLQDTDSNSAPQTPSALELDDRRSSNSRSTSALQNNTHAYGGYNLVGDEATDAGYKDEDDSMELSDGTEGVVAHNASNTISNSASPSLSWSAPRLQDSVLMHDEKSTLGYTDRRLGSEMHPKLKQHECTYNKTDGTTQEDTVQETTNLADDSDQQQAPGDIRLSNQLGYSLPILPENESVEGDPHAIIAAPRAAQKETNKVETSDLDGPDADKEDTVRQSSRAQRQKSPHRRMSKLEMQISPLVSPFRNENEEAQLLVPNTPTAPDQFPDQFHLQSANESVPETPFTKTLSYYKQFQGTENSSPKRRRHTALPQEIAKVIAHTDPGTGPPDQTKTSQTADTNVSPTTSALVDLEEMMFAGVSKDIDIAPHFTDKQEAPRQDMSDAESAPDESRKQLILYPQHPAFVNAIGMIPATMFWVITAPIVKYTNMAVDLLVDKLRDTYL